VAASRANRVAQGRAKRDGQVEACVPQRTDEVAWQDADDGPRNAIDAKHTSEHGRITREQPLPYGVGQHHDGWRTRSRVGIGQRASECRPDAERWEESRLHFQRGHDAGAILAEVWSVERHPAECGDAGEGALPVRDVVDHTCAQRTALLRAIEQASIHTDEAVGIGVRQCIEQHRLDDTENRRIRADAEREREDREQ
jgi:hypothetical protein